MSDSNDPEDLDLIAFDLDGTLALSKSDIDPEMADLLTELLQKKKVAVASGGAFPQFKNQLINNLPPRADLSNLYILSESGSNLHAFINNEWKAVYDNKLNDEEKKKIFNAFEKGLKEAGFEKPEKIYGVLIEDRGAQITFSANGSNAPLAIKGPWDPDHKKRLKIKEKIDNYLPDFNVKIGGTNTIDITRKGIDKAFGMEYLMDHLKIAPEKTIYVGDALFPGGNDSSVLRLSIHTKEVENVDDTKKFIRSFIN